MKAALSLSENQISYIKGSVRGKKIKIYKNVKEEIEKYVIDNGLINDVNRLSKILSIFAGKYMNKRNKINVIIDLDNVILREIVVPIAKEKALREIVKNEIMSSLGVSEDYIIDYTILSKNKKVTTCNVLVFALNKKIIKDYYDVLANANIQCNSLDIAINCKAKLYSFIGKEEKAFLAMTINDESIDFLLVEHSFSILTRRIKISLNNFQENNALDIAFEEIINHINKILQFQKTRNKIEEIKKIYISGNSSEMDELCEAIFLGTSLKGVPFSQHGWLIRRKGFDAENYIVPMGSLIRR